MSAAVASAAAHLHADAQLDARLRELSAFVRIPSVGAQSGHAPDMRRAARWLARRVRRAGLRRVEVVPTGGAPLVLAHHPAPPRRPTLLLYGHYDVQPAEPVEGWTVPPFGGGRRDDRIYGRGATDDKGQVLAQVCAVESLLAGDGSLPVGVLLVVEGEEETGSRHLLGLLGAAGRGLAADAAIVSDSRMRSARRPALVGSLRGNLALELSVATQRKELHSGPFGGAVPDTAAILCRLVASLHRPDGTVAVRGFYDRVRPRSGRARAALKRDGPGDEELRAQARALALGGEPGWSAYERTVWRPSLTVAGLTAGYEDEGMKAVVPHRARAKLDVRLVPDQTPEDVERLLRTHLAARLPPGARGRLRPLARAQPVEHRLDHPVALAAARALRRAFGVAPARMGSGGTIPVAEALERRCGVPTVLMGFADPGADIHGPDEHIAVPTFAAAIHALIELLAELARWP